MTIDDRYAINGHQAIILKSDRVSLTVIPELGGVISSIRYIPSNIEVLAQTRAPDSVSIYKESKVPDNLLDLLFVGGYYEVLPNAGYSCTYGGAPLGLHDETPYLPWKAEFDEDRDPNSVLLIANLVKFPLKLYKRLTVVDGDVIINERLLNTSPTATVPFSWLHHPTFGEQFIDEETRLLLPDRTEIEVDSTLESETTCLEAGYRGQWPLAREKNGEFDDLSKFPAKNVKNCDDLAYVPKLSEGRFTIKSPRSKINLDVKWDKDLFGSLWLWRPFGGGNAYPWYGRMYCTAVEITTSVPASGLADQVKLGTAKWIKPGEEIVTTLRYEFKEDD